MPERVYVSAVLASAVEPSGTDTTRVNLTDVGTREWLPSDGAAKISIHVYMTFFFVDARVGDHPVRIKIVDRTTRTIFERETRSISAPAPMFSYAFSVELANVSVPIGLHQLAILVDGEPRAILPIQVGPRPGQHHG